MKLSQWFDIWSLDKPQEGKEIQLEGLKESVNFILDVVNNEAKFVPLEKIVLGGFSTGCATAVMALLSFNERLGGFIGFSGWLPFYEEIESIAKKTAEIGFTPLSDLYTRFGVVQDSDQWLETVLNTLVFISHSRDDNIVSVYSGGGIYFGLTSLGMDIAWAGYAGGGHWLNEPHGVDDLVAFLKKNVLSFNV